MSDDVVHRRKRVSDGGLSQSEGDATPVRILPSGDRANGNTLPSSTDTSGDWVIEFGRGAQQDDPTARLPLESEANRPLRPGTLYTPAIAPQPQPQSIPPPAPQPPPPQREGSLPPPYAHYDYAPLPTPAIDRLPPDRSLSAERTAEQGDKQPVTVIKRGPSACSILGATFGIIAVACALLAFATIRDGFSGLGNLFGWVPNLFGPPKVSFDTTRPSVIQQVSALSRLETVQYEVEKVVEGKSQGPLWDIFTSDKILLIAHGDVIAGVDLSKLKPEDIKVMTDTGSVTIKLPKAEIFNPKTILDTSLTRVYDRSGGIIPMTDPNLETRVRQVAEEQIMQASIENGVLSKAQQNAQEVVRSLITGLGYKDVKFDSGP